MSATTATIWGDSMSTRKSFDRVCIAVLIASLLLTALFMNGAAFGLESSARSMGYESRLFDTSKVHTLAIVIDDWEGFLENCESEEYAPCSVVIDNESYKNVGLRAKGNTSLTTVRSMDSSRYSLKIEFDHYENGKTYHGLDKLCLNNIIQDNTYMKDYLTYRMMDEFGADAPLCSYVWITVNGEDWGLYLAVEGIEDSFLQRNYGSDYGDLYKPDSMSFGGGGPGRGRDFRMSEFWNEANADNGADSASDSAANAENVSNSAANTENAFRQRGGMRGMGGGRPFPGMPFPGGTGGQSTASGGAAPDFDAFDPTGGFGDMPFPGFGNFPGMGDASGDGTDGGFPGGFGGMRGMGSDDVKLKYTDDNPESYGSIFDNAKTDVTAADKARLIASLKSLGEMENLESVVNMDEVLRYFVVHNYVVNGDSYTGSMIHNYYLYEKDGQLSMIPWDYNLAFGGFQGGSASESVNDPIDTPLSVSGDGDRPMADWLAQEEYVDLYHAYFNDFLNSVDATAIIDAAYPLIASYVERDPTKFCSYEDFEKGVTALRTFCELRTESVYGQLNGSIPSTDDGQSADNSALVDASGLTLSDMGNMGFGGGRGGRFGRANGETSGDAQESGVSGDGEQDASGGGEQDALPGMMGFPDGNFPGNTGGDSPDNMSGGFPDGGQTASDDGQTLSNGSQTASDDGQTASDNSQMLSDDGFSNGGTGGNFPGSFPGGGFPGGGTGNGFPGGGPGGDFPDGAFPGFQSDGGTSVTALSRETWIALGASVVVLCAGLLTARLYQRRKRFA